MKQLGLMAGQNQWSVGGRDLAALEHCEMLACGGAKIGRKSGAAIEFGCTLPVLSNQLGKLFQWRVDNSRAVLNRGAKATVNRAGHEHRRGPPSGRPVAELATSRE